MEAITGTAAGVPYTALPPASALDGPAPLIVTWHMLDAPRTDAAFAAALPMTGVPAWRVHLGMPMCGARMVDGRVDAAIELARKDAVMAFLARSPIRPPTSFRPHSLHCANSCRLTTSRSAFSAPRSAEPWRCRC